VEQVPREPGVVENPGDAPVEGAARRTLGDGCADWLVREEPLLVRVHGQQLLTMRTPGRDEDLAVGFLLGEGVIDAPADVVETRTARGDGETLTPDAIDVVLADPTDARIRGRLTRTHEIRASCGVCGLTDPDELLEDLQPLLPGVPRLDVEAIADRRRRFEEAQPLFARTGGCHAATVFGPDGELWGAAEDVGRHNALDKAIGQAARAGRPLSRGAVMLSGRAGFDLVLKCLRARVPVILSVSAASALSFDLCRTAGATLVGFVRPGRHKVYWDAGRIVAGRPGGEGGREARGREEDP
jgi:FdhD protein